jgi:lysine decarboxylase
MTSSARRHPTPVLDDQTQAPYLDALCAHADRHPTSFNVPSHHGRADLSPALAHAFGERTLAMDVPPIIEGIDAGPQPTPFERAQRLAAAAWGARRTWFLANGASSANHAVCLTLAQLGREVVVQRNVHTSTIDGLIVAGLQPTFAVPEVDSRLGIAHCLRPEELDRALHAATAPTAAIVVSPTYYGFAADLAGCRAVADRYGVPLIVDEAWGSHFAFSDRLPLDAISAGAALAVSSTHKLLGSLTQSAMLHAGPASALDDDIVERSVSLLESTSPSALLAGSLDGARQRAATAGRELLDQTIEAMIAVRAGVNAIPGLAALDERLIGSFGIAGHDPLHLAIDVEASGRSGGEINRYLNRTHGVFVELVAERVLVAIFGMGEAAADAEPLLGGLRAAVQELPESDGIEMTFGLPGAGELIMSPQQAYFSPSTSIEIGAAASRIAAETLAVYPPGIPNVLPGERITQENLDHVRAAHARGLSVRGPVDRTLETVRVVAES